MGLLDTLRSFGQGASNSVASNVSAPVDGLAWLLRKGGLPIPQNPVSHLLAGFKFADFVDALKLCLGFQRAALPLFEGWFWFDHPAPPITAIATAFCGVSAYTLSHGMAYTDAPHSFVDTFFGKQSNFSAIGAMTDQSR